MIKGLLFSCLLIISNIAMASNSFSQFLKSCGYGALIGGGIGVVSLAFGNKPSQHYANVARGLSLGLYAGVAFGAYQAFGKNQPQYKYYQDMDYSTSTVIIPKMVQARIDGLEVSSTVYNF
jgi:hypothetical protein